MPPRDDIAHAMTAQEWQEANYRAHLHDLLRGVTSQINPERFSAAVEQMPMSTNIEDDAAGLRPPDAMWKSLRSTLYRSRYSPERSNPLARAAGFYDIR
jgi:hypothetical protein